MRTTLYGKMLLNIVKNLNYQSLVMPTFFFELKIKYSKFTKYPCVKESEMPQAVNLIWQKFIQDLQNCNFVFLGKLQKKRFFVSWPLRQGGGGKVLGH